MVDIYMEEHMAVVNNCHCTYVVWMTASEEEEEEG